MRPSNSLERTGDVAPKARGDQSAGWWIDVRGGDPRPLTSFFVVTSHTILDIWPRRE